MPQLAASSNTKPKSHMPPKRTLPMLIGCPASLPAQSQLTVTLWA